MFEFDINEAEFLAPAADRETKATPAWSPTMELQAELGLLSVAESEEEYRSRR